MVRKKCFNNFEMVILEAVATSVYVVVAKKKKKHVILTSLNNCLKVCYFVES